MAGSADRSRWAVLALLFVCRASLGIQFQSLGSVSGYLAAEFGLSFAEIGTLIGLFMLPGMLLSLPSGYAGRFASDRTLVALGLLAMGAGAAIATAASGFGGFAAARLASGVGFVVGSIYFTKMVADWFAGRELATAMGVLVMSWPFGIAIGQVGNGWLAAHLGWRMPFAVAAGYSIAAAAALWLGYRAPPQEGHGAGAPALSLPRRELVLTLLASVVWAAFNAAYIVFLSFAPRVLEAGGYRAADAAGVVSLASWVLIFSGTVCGQIADRTGRPDLVLYVCLTVAIAALLALPYTALAVALCLAFGLVGMAPAGVIMALTGRAMAPSRRALGMGVFSTAYYVLVAPAPALAGWLYDRSGSAYGPIVFAAALFGVTALANIAFRASDKALA